jgi:RNA polymerase sigma-70 factor (ECF subfamily)
MHSQMISENNDVLVLVEKVKNGDQEAFMDLTRLYQKKVFIVAYSFFRNKDDALDIVQETFLRCYQKIHSFKVGKSFRNWLLQITKNLCIDHYRKHHKKDEYHLRDERIDDMALASNENSSFLESTELKELFSRGLETLTERQRMVFVLKHYNGLKYKEISEVMSVALGTVKSLHFKAVQNLKTCLAPHFGGMK